EAEAGFDLATHRPGRAAAGVSGVGGPQGRRPQLVSYDRGPWTDDFRHFARSTTETPMPRVGFRGNRPLRRRRCTAEPRAAEGAPWGSTPTHTPNLNGVPQPQVKQPSLTPQALHIRAQGRRRRTLGIEPDTHAEPRRGSTARGEATVPYAAGVGHQSPGSPK